MKTPLYQRFSYSRISFTGVMFLAVFMVACNQIETPAQTTPTVAASESQPEDSVIAIPDQPIHPKGDKSAEQESTSTNTSVPEPTITTQPDEVSIATPTPDSVSTEGQDNNTVGLDTSQFDGVDVEIFSLSNAEQIAPEDILQEISFSSGAGGDAVCFGSFDSPSVYPETPTHAVLNELVSIHICGWQIGETIKIAVDYPNGTTIASEQENAFLQMTFEFMTNVLTDPPGEYVVTFTGDSGTVQHNITLTSPATPQIYWNDDGTLVLYNFEPQETVRVFAYYGVPSLVTTFAELQAWQTFNVDQQGNLVILLTKIPGNWNWFAAVGDISGEVQIDPSTSPRSFGTSGGSVLAWPVSETGIEACHLSPGDLVTAGENARIWSQPNVISGSSIQSIAFGQKLEILSSPRWGIIRQDIDVSGWWWEVAIQADNASGWLWQERIVECAN